MHTYEYGLFNRNREKCNFGYDSFSFYDLALGWRKNNSYFYFPSLISNCVIYRIKKIFATGRAKQKIFRGRPKALKISILFKMMNFFLHQTIITATIFFHTSIAYENTCKKLSLCTNI